MVAGLLAPLAARATATIAIGAFRLDHPPEQGGLALGWAPAATRRLVVDGQDVAMVPDGRFIIGFGRDRAPVAVLTAFLADGNSITERLTVLGHAWQIEHLTTVQRYPQPDAEFQARRPAELAQIKAAREIDVKSDGWRQGFLWPAKGRISGLFGAQRIYAGEAGAPHAGVDIAAGAGTLVRAPADGFVILAAASPFTLEGNLLMVGHGMSLDSAFLHLSKISVKHGETVRQGQIIGAVGATGRASGPHLHWGMKWKDERIDPERLAH